MRTKPSCRKGDHTPARLACCSCGASCDPARPDAAETHLARAQSPHWAARLRPRPGRLGDRAASVTESSASLRTDRRHFAAARPAGGRSAYCSARRSWIRANFSTLQHIAGSYLTLGAMPSLIAAFDRALSILPDSIETRATRGAVHLCWKADTWSTAPRAQSMQSSPKDRSAIANAAASGSAPGLL